jgi:hypothetical protein
VARGVNVQAQEALAQSVAGACEFGARDRRWSEWPKRVAARVGGGGTACSALECKRWSMDARE